MQTRLGLGFLVLVFFFLNLGGYDLSAPDEPRYALVAREMLTGNHWIILHQNQTPYSEKPPLFFWTIGILAHAAGGLVNAWTARLPSAIAATLVLIFMWRWSRWDDKSTHVSILTILVLMSCAKFFFQARMAQIDMVLTVFTTAALIIVFYAIQGKSYSPFWLGMCLGAGMLTKGPVGLFIPIGSACTFALLEGRGAWRNIPVKGVLWGFIPILMWLVFLLVAVNSYNQWLYLDNLLFKQTVVRYFNSWVHLRPFYYFLVTFQYDFLPWTPILLLAIPFTRKKWSALDSRQKYSWVIIVFTILFFSLSRGKRNLYLLPLFPFAAYLVALKINSLLVKPKFNLKEKSAWGALGLIVFALGLSCVIVASGLIKLPFNWIETPIPSAMIACFGILLIPLSTAIVYFGFNHNARYAFGGAIIAMLLINILMYSFIMPWISPFRSAKNFMARTNEIIHKQIGEPVVGMVRYRSAYRFYGDFPLVELVSCDDMVDFWKNHTTGWVIIRDTEFMTCPSEVRNKIKVHYKKHVGRGHQYFLTSL